MDDIQDILDHAHGSSLLGWAKVVERIATYSPESERIRAARIWAGSLDDQWAFAQSLTREIDQMNAVFTLAREVKHCMDTWAEEDLPSDLITRVHTLHLDIRAFITGAPNNESPGGTT